MEIKRRINSIVLLYLFIVAVFAAPLPTYAVCFYEKEPNPFQNDPFRTESKDAADKFYDIARSYRENKQDDKALDFFEKCLQIDPDHVCANNGLAWLLLTTHDPKHRDLQRAIKHAERAVKDEGSGCGPCWDTLGLALYRSGEIDKPHLCYLKSMALSGDCDETARNNYVEYLLKERKGYGSYLADALKRRRGTADLFNEGGRLLFESKKPLDALDHYTVALLIDPELSVAYFSRAQAWFELHEDLMTLFDTDMAIQKNHEFSGLYELRGRVFARHMMTGQALASFGKALSLSPENDAALFNRGVMYLKIRVYRRALADFDLAIQIVPSSPHRFFARALAYKNLKDYEAAIDDLKKALEIDPEFEKARILLNELMAETEVQDNL